MNFSQIEENNEEKFRSNWRIVLGMLCVWDKKKLELEQRQQLGGGGAQSIKVCLTICWFFSVFLFVVCFFVCLFVWHLMHQWGRGAKHQGSIVNYTEESSPRCWKTGSLWQSLNLFWYWTIPARWSRFLIYDHFSRRWSGWSSMGAGRSPASPLMDIGSSLGLPGID